MTEPSNPINSADNKSVEDIREDAQTLYEGELELNIPAPVNLKLASMLFNCLQTIHDLRVVLTKGTFTRGVTITITLEKPIPLIKTLSSKLPGIEIIPKIIRTDGFGSESIVLPEIIKKPEIVRLVLVPKEV